MLLLLAACSGSGGGASGGAEASAFTPVSGTVLEFAPEGAKEALHDTGAPASPSPVSILRIQVLDATWEVSRDGVGAGSLAWALGDDGLTVGDSHLLPARLAEGEEEDGVRVTTTGSDEVWYGTFATTATVEVDAGELAGADTVAEALGPVRVTFGGEAWELVYYERPSE